MTLEPFARVVKRVSGMKIPGMKIPGGSIQELIEKRQPETEVESAVLTVVTQLGLVDTLKCVGLKPTILLGKGTGELACACWFDLITPEEALVAAANGTVGTLLADLDGNKSWRSISQGIMFKW